MPVNTCSSQNQFGYVLCGICYGAQLLYHLYRQHRYRTCSELVRVSASRAAARQKRWCKNGIKSAASTTTQ